MKRVRKIALFDMDGTLVDYHSVLERDMKKLMSPGEKEINLNFNDNLPKYLKERKKLITSQPEWWFNLPVLKPGWDILLMCIKIGFEIMILTKGPFDRDLAWSEKVRWCRKYFGSDINITITEDKSVVYGRVLVDDYPTYAFEWLKWRPRGLVIMPKSSVSEGVYHDNIEIYDRSVKSRNRVLKRLNEAFLR